MIILIGHQVAQRMHKVSQRLQFMTKAVLCSNQIIAIFKPAHKSACFEQITNTTALCLCETHGFCFNNSEKILRDTLCPDFVLHCDPNFENFVTFLNGLCGSILEIPVNHIQASTINQSPVTNHMYFLTEGSLWLNLPIF